MRLALALLLAPLLFGSPVATAAYEIPTAAFTGSAPPAPPSGASIPALAPAKRVELVPAMWSTISGRWRVGEQMRRRTCNGKAATPRGKKIAASARSAAVSKRQPQDRETRGYEQVQILWIQCDCRGILYPESHQTACGGNAWQVHLLWNRLERGRHLRL
jgi:hypothetical protein